MLFVQLLARFDLYNIAISESTKMNLSRDADFAELKREIAKL